LITFAPKETIDKKKREKERERVRRGENDMV